MFMSKVSEHIFSSRASRHLMSLPGKQRSACDTLSSPSGDQSLITNRYKEIWATPRYLLVSLPNQKKSIGLFSARCQKRADAQLPLPRLLGLHHAHVSEQYRSSKAERKNGLMSVILGMAATAWAWKKSHQTPGNIHKGRAESCCPIIREQRYRRFGHLSFYILFVQIFFSWEVCDCSEYPSSTEDERNRWKAPSVSIP